MAVKKKNRNSSEPLSLGQRLRKLRVEVLQADQKSFARQLGVSQGIVSHWERDVYVPSAMALMAIGRHAPVGESAYWFEQAGEDHADRERRLLNYKEAFEVNDEDNQVVGFYGQVGAGPPRFPLEDAEFKVSLPRSWFHPAHRIVGFRVAGDSMSPLIERGFLVLVDINDKEPRQLIGSVVAVRDPDGTVIKRLRKESGEFKLYSQNEYYPPIAVDTEETSILGRVVKWIGEPPPSKR